MANIEYRETAIDTGKKTLCMFPWICISPIATACSYFHENLVFIAFVSLIPFFFVLDSAEGEQNASLSGFIWGTLHAGVLGKPVIYALTGHYDTGLLYAAAFFIAAVILPYGLLYAAFAYVYKFLCRERSLFFRSAVVPALWTTCEYIKEVAAILLPWGNIGNSISSFTEFVQIADIAGGYGVTYMVVLINSTLLLQLYQGFVFKKKFSSHNIPPVIIALCSLAIPLLYGYTKILSFKGDFDFGQSRNVVLVQGNYDSKQRWMEPGFKKRVSGLTSLGRSAGTEGPTLYVWPETVLNSPSKMNNDFFKELGNNFLYGDTLITGGVNRDKETGLSYNCAWMITGRRKSLPYEKRILLPHAETSAAGFLLEAFGSAPGSFSTGRISKPFKLDKHLVGLSICMEILYPEYISGIVNDGAGVIVNISNDAWFGRTTMPYLHLSAARMRAIENKRYVLRCANSGYSAIITPTGEVRRRSGLFVREAIQGTFETINGLTLYCRWGNWIVIFSGLIIVYELIVTGFLRKDYPW